MDTNHSCYFKSTPPTSNVVSLDLSQRHPDCIYGIIWIYYRPIRVVSRVQLRSFLAFEGVSSLVYVAIIWGRYVLRKSVFQGHHTKSVQKGIMCSMSLFAVSGIILSYVAFGLLGTAR